MKVDIKVEDVSSIQRKVLYTISKQSVTDELDKAYSSLKKNANIKGFRKGKVPTHILEKKFGSSITEDVTRQFDFKGFASVELPFEVVGQPSVVEEDVGLLRKNESFSFSIMVETKPDLNIENYNNMEVPYDTLRLAKKKLIHR